MKNSKNLGVVLITDRQLCNMPLIEAVKIALRGGVTTIQLRERNLEDNEFLGIASELRRITSDAGACFIVNGHADIAVAVDADGIHMGKGSLPIERVREIVGNEKLIGFSAHNIEEAKHAQNSGADYISYSPVFFTSSKNGVAGQKPIGPEAIEEVKQIISIPVIALGGINKNNVKQVLRMGADGIAVISAILKEKDLYRAAFDLSETFKNNFLGG